MWHIVEIYVMIVWLLTIIQNQMISPLLVMNKIAICICYFIIGGVLHE